MVIVLMGNSCVGKSTIAELLRRQLSAELISGKDYLRLGILTAAVPAGSILLTQILQGVAAQLWAVELDFVPGAESSVLLGLLFLALSLLCRYGAELTENAA